jgi:hypothetical protein
MGKFSFNISPEFIKQLGRLAEVEKYAPQMIDESMPILEKNLKSELSKHRRTGIMLDSVKKTKAGKTKNGGYFAQVRPTGTSTEYIGDDGKRRQRKEPVRNMEILAHLEYGTKEQAPTPILTKAIKDSEAAVLDKMQEVFNREVVKGE